MKFHLLAHACGQISSNLNLRPWDHSKICSQLLGNEEDGRARLRGSFAGTASHSHIGICHFATHFQCSIPAFEGLLEGEHNRRLMKLLYRTAEWHALAKLRIQTESSLELLDDLTTEFGQLLRQFRDLTCTRFTTVELPREAEARERRRQEKNTTSSGQADNTQGGQGGQTRE
jgi:hypothetical protein